jgi:hypothetical protein
MRAYKGKIEASSPLAPQPAKAAPVKENRAAPRPATAAPAPIPVANGPSTSVQGSNILSIIAIIVLAVAAVGLTIALLIK